MKRLALVSIACLAILSTSGAFSSAQSPVENLFNNNFPPQSITPSPYGLAALVFEANPGALASGRLQIQLPFMDGARRVMQRKSAETRGPANVAWFGELESSPGSQVVLTLKQGLIAGRIRFDEFLCEIRPLSNGKHVLELLDQSKFPACGGVQLPPPPTAAPSEETAAGDAVLQTVAAATDIDVMAVYTPQARTAAGGATQIQALIQSAVDSANSAFTNSQINARYVLKYAGEVAYNDSGNLSTDLTWVQSNATVADLRNQYKADLVSLFVENGGGSCGIGYVQNSVASWFADYAFQVTARACAVGNLTYAHEHGHNLGMEHDPANGGASSSASYPYSFGHYVQGVFRTVMSYSNAGSCTNCPRIAYFSNPNVSYGGYPTGVANQRDNARTANNALATVAAFRTSTTSSPPAAPSSLTASAASTTQINLTWTDAATNETGFKVERSTDGANFTELATVGAGATSYANTGLNAATVYYYRVRAYNSSGNSGYSNTASAATPTAGPSAPSNLAATVVSSSQVNLSWTDRATNETGFKIERSTDGAAYTQIAAIGAGLVAYSDTTVSNLTSCYYRVRSYNSSGHSAYSNVATVTLATPPPAPWLSADINSPTPAGSVGYSNGVFTVAGGGSISGKADKFRFVYQTLSGDGEIKLRINSVQNTSASARSGVMIRETLTGSSKMAFMGVDGSGVFRWLRRSSTKGSVSTSSGPGGSPPNTWVRLVRTGDLFSGYYSADGVNWTLLTSYNIAMTSNIYVGLAVGSGSTTALNTSVFNTVTVVP